MSESKIELTERLRREGRWSEASKFKDTVIKECRARGVKKAEAAEHAWEEMARAFPPLPAAQPPSEPAAEVPTPEPSGSPTPAADHCGQSGPGALGFPPAAEEDFDVDALLQRSGDRQPPDLARDTLWAYQHLANRKAKPLDAPSPGAWSLLQWAKQYRNRFFEQILPKAMAAYTSDDEQDQRRERKSIDEITSILGRMEEQWAEELVANVPETVRAKVRSILEDWARRSALMISSEAKADLEAHISRLVQDCLDVLAPAPGGR